jgi:purine operon repressor
MEKFQRNERIAYITRTLMNSPGKIFSLSCFMDVLGAAKSTISEDIDVIRNVMRRFEQGNLESVAGASGGVIYIPSSSYGRVEKLLFGIRDELKKKERILPGGFLYTLDIIYNPVFANQIGEVFAGRFSSSAVDYVITVETKGIPIAYATAMNLGKPLIIVRHNSEVTDGASVNINYVSGSANKIQTMVLSIKALKRNSNLLFIDDFMKAGGTAKGILDLAKQFNSEISGIGVLIETEKPYKKLVDNYISLLSLKKVDEVNDEIDIQISDKILRNEYWE